MQLKIGSATVPVAAVCVAPTAPGAPGPHPMGLDLGCEIFSARGRKLRARRSRSPKQLHRSGLANGPRRLLSRLGGGQRLNATDMKQRELLNLCPSLRRRTRSHTHEHSGAEDPSEFRMRHVVVRSIRHENPKRLEGFLVEQFLKMRGCHHHGVRITRALPRPAPTECCHSRAVAFENRREFSALPA